MTRDRIEAISALKLRCFCLPSNELIMGQLMEEDFEEFRIINPIKVVQSLEFDTLDQEVFMFQMLPGNITGEMIIRKSYVGYHYVPSFIMKKDYVDILQINRVADALDLEDVQGSGNTEKEIIIEDPPGTDWDSIKTQYPGRDWGDDT